MTKKVPKTPEESTGDIVHRGIRIGIGSVPFVGSAAAEIFQWVIQPPLEKRREEWMAQVGELLEELSSKGVDLKTLQDNSEFITVVMHASQIAVRNHHEFKKEALRNAIRNVAIGQTIDDAIRHVFLDLIDTFAELHVRILRLYQAPPQVPASLSVV